MQVVEDVIKQKIYGDYKSVRAFSKLYKIPYSTIDNLFKRGINSLSLNTLHKIIRPLNLEVIITCDGIHIRETRTD